MVVDNIKNYNRINDIALKCESCNCYDHLTHQCGLLSYKPINKKVPILKKKKIMNFEQ
jgi:hypothetical protein